MSGLPARSEVGGLGVDAALQGDGASLIGNLLTSLELAASAFTDGAKVGLTTEVRYREKGDGHSVVE